MGSLGLLVVGSSIWMAMDSSRLGYDKRDIRGLAAVGPTGWLLAGLFLWVVAFPLYLFKRNELKAAGERRRQALFGEQAPGVTLHLPPAPAFWQAPGPGPNANSPRPLGSEDADVADQIVKLAQLRESGILSDEEFQRGKSRLL